MVQLGNDWDGLLAPEFEKDYYKKLRAFLKSEYANNDASNEVKYYLSFYNN